MSHKVPKKKKNALVLGLDLGGTKLASGVINSRGKVLDSLHVPVQMSQGKDAVLKQILSTAQDWIHQYPEIQAVGLASAGPLDPSKGVLLDPTNFVSPHGRWGKVPIAPWLSKRLKLPVTLENDAAAAILAEAWVGAARGKKNAMILTLGTGLGTGIICNGQLMRAGRGLHPEAGHIQINYTDTRAICGCGNLGCAEAYLSGNGFARWASEKLRTPKQLSGREIAELARKGDPRALEVFYEYAQVLAVAIQSYVAIYAPEVIVFTGSFAQSGDLFLKDTHGLLKKGLERRRVGTDLLPKLVQSKLDNQAGILGGAFIALENQGRK